MDLTVDSKPAASMEPATRKRKQQPTAREPPSVTEDDRKIAALSLVLPFLLAGDLSKVGAVNRACRVIAVESYKKRLRTPWTPLQRGVTDNTTSNTSRLRVYKTKENIPACYRKENKWCHQEELMCGLVQSARPKSLLGVKWKENVSGTWEVEWRYDPLHLHWRKGILQRPTQLQGTLRHVRLAGCSLRDGILLVIAYKYVSWTDDLEALDNYDEDTFDDAYSFNEDFGKELWCICYSLNSSASDSASTTSFEPTFVQKLNAERCQCNVEDSLNVSFGEFLQSNNGKVLAVVASYLGPNSANLGGEESHQEITIFDFDQDSTAVVPRYKIKVPFYDGDDDGTLQLSMTTGGEFLSILCQEQLRFMGEGRWAVYDIRGATSFEKLLEYDGYARAGQEIHFTPDNDLACYIEDSILAERPDASEQAEQDLSNVLPYVRNAVLMCTEDE